MDTALAEITDIINKLESLTVEDYEKLKIGLTNILDKVVQNVDNIVYKTIRQYGYKIYNNIDDLMYILDIPGNSDNIIIYVEDAKCYILFEDISAYDAFMIKTDPIISILKRDFIKYQIVLSDKKQKLTFAYNTDDRDILDEVIEQTRIHFRAKSMAIFNPAWNTNQLIIDIGMHYFDNNREYSYGLYKHLESYKKGYGKNLQIPPFIYNIQWKREYILCLVGYVVDRAGILRDVISPYNNTGREMYIPIGNPTNTIMQFQQLPVSHEYIYFIVEEPYADRVKIGKTINLDNRIKTLQTGNPRCLNVYHHVVKPISDKYELSLHMHFANRRISGEWFQFAHQELPTIIKNIQS